MADFSFAPDPHYGWGSRINMGQSLYDAMRNGLSLQGALDQQRMSSAQTDMNLHLLPTQGDDIAWRLRADRDAMMAQDIRQREGMRQSAGAGYFTPSDYYTPNGQYTTTGMTPSHFAPPPHAGNFGTPAVSGAVPGTPAANTYSPPVPQSPFAPLAPPQSPWGTPMTAADPYAAQYATDPSTVSFSGG